MFTPDAKCKARAWHARASSQQNQKLHAVKHKGNAKLTDLTLKEKKADINLADQTT